MPINLGQSVTPARGMTVQFLSSGWLPIDDVELRPAFACAAVIPLCGAFTGWILNDHEATTSASMSCAPTNWL